MLKGSMQDIMMISVLVLISAIGIVIVYAIVDQVGEKIEPEMNVSAIEDSKTALKTFNAGFILLIGAFLIAAIISAAMIRTHPVFIVPAIIFLVAIILVAAQFTNIYETFIVSDSTVTDSANEFDIIVAILRNWPIIVLGLGVIMMIVMFSKVTGEGGGFGR